MICGIYSKFYPSCCLYMSTWASVCAWCPW